jgi:hypothetical protein
MFASQDVDGDGLITHAEHTAFVSRRFEAVDTNADGAITKVEADAARNMTQERMRQRRD